MSFRLSRRTMLVSAASLPVLAACSSSEDELPAPPENEGRIEGVHTAIAYMESQNGGRFGVSAVNLATGQTITHRGDERFAMCSSFKWLLAALVLQRVQAGEEDLSRMIELLEEAVGKPAERNLLPMQPGDVRATYADIDAIHGDLGYKPTTPIDVGIPNFVSWYKSYHGLA